MLVLFWVWVILSGPGNSIIPLQQWWDTGEWKTTKEIIEQMKADQDFKYKNDPIFKQKYDQLYERQQKEEYWKANRVERIHKLRENARIREIRVQQLRKKHFAQ